MLTIKIAENVEVVVNYLLSKIDSHKKNSCRLCVK